MQQEGLLSSTFFNFLNRVFLILSSFLLGLYASRFLSTSEFGTAQFINWNATFIWMIANMGIPSLLNRFVPGPNGNKKFNQLLIHSFRMLALALVLAFMLTVVITGIDDSYLAVTIALVGIHMLNYFLVSWMQSLLLYKRVFLVQGAASASTLVIGGLFIPVFGLNGFIFCLFWLHTVSFGFLIFYFVKQIKYRQANVDLNFSDELDQKLIVRTTAYFAVSAVLASLLWQRCEYYFIKQELSQTSIALYAVAFSVISLATEPFRLLTGTFTTYFARHFNLQSNPSDMFTTMFRFIWIFTVFTSVFLWVFTDQILLFFYPKEYIACVSLIKILLPGVFLGVCSYVVMSYHVAAGKARFLLTQDSIAALILIGLVLFAVRFYPDIESIAMARSVALAATVVLGLIYSIVRLNLKFPFYAMGMSFLISAVLIGTSFFLKPSGWFQVSLFGLGSFITYLLLLAMFRVVTPEEVKLLKTQVTDFLKLSKT